MTVINCGDPGTPSNGDTEGTVTTFGSIVNHTCNEGYVLIGANERECLANESWSAPLSSCDSKSLYVRNVHIWLCTLKDKSSIVNWSFTLCCNYVYVVCMCVCVWV